MSVLLFMVLATLVHTMGGVIIAHSQLGYLNLWRGTSPCAYSIDFTYCNYCDEV
ncbi:hypothetical protein ABIC60_003810 [Phyllobacterium ifriqiyense]